MTRREHTSRFIGKRAANFISRLNNLKKLYKGYLKKIGWLNSIDQIQAVDRNGDPAIWITYPAAAMLKRIINSDMRVFEYGSGNSSLWWASRVHEVVSVEHNVAWSSFVQQNSPNNLTVFSVPMNSPHSPDNTREFFETYDSDKNFDINITQDIISKGFEEYADTIRKFNKEHFDIIVIDGVARILCTWMALKYIKSDGLIVFDNADRFQYNTAFKILNNNGFKRIDFYGISPMNTYESCTAIFARDLSRFTTYLIPRDQVSDNWNGAPEPASSSSDEGTLDP